MRKEVVRAFRSLFKPTSRSTALQILAKELGSSAPSPEIAILLGLSGAGASFAIRLLASRFVGEGEYFLTAFPFVLVVTLVAGRWAGWSCLVFSLLGGWYLFIGEAFSFALGENESGILVGSFVVGVITIHIAELMRRTFRELETVRERDRLLSRELEHRVKNTLTLVLSLSRQTFRKGSEIEAARAEFEGRVMALAAAQTIVGKMDMQTAPLREVVARSLAPFCGGRGDRVVASGPDVLLTADAAMGLCLVFHELATNASKYGALSVAIGEIRIVWRILDAGKNLAIHWQEQGGPPVEAPKRKGFGSQLFEKIVTRQLKGSGELDYARTGVQVRLSLPLGSVNDAQHTVHGKEISPTPRRA